jgi:hypothetical protein
VSSKRSWMINISVLFVRCCGVSARAVARVEKTVRSRSVAQEPVPGVEEFFF